MREENTAIVVLYPTHITEINVIIYTIAIYLPRHLIAKVF